MRPEDAWGPHRERPRRATDHSPQIINGRPVDLQPLTAIDLAKWDSEPVPERRWLVPDLIPEDEVTMLSGDGGNGKSLLALQLAVAAVLDRLWIGQPVRRCKVLGIFCEDSETELRIRLHSILDHYGATFGDLAENLHISSRKGQDSALMEWPDRYAPGVVTALYTRIEAAAIEHGAELVILDSLHDLFSGDEIKRTHARQFTNALASIASQIHGAVLLNAHPSLAGRNSGTGESGSTGWRNSVRSMQYLTRPNDDDYRILKTMKANRGPQGGSIRLRWQHGVFVADEPAPVPGLLGTIARRDAERVFLELLVKMGKEGRSVSESRHAGNFAPKLFGSRPDRQGYSTADFRRAMESLFAAGKITTEHYGRKSDERRRIAAVTAPTREGAE